VSFVQATLVVRSSANKSDQFESWEKAMRLQISLATKLRLTPSSRFDPTTIGRQRQPAPPRPWE
jgi:hypothetical protein